MSLTYKGVIISLLGALLQFAGVPVVDEKISTFLEVTLQIVGAGIALWGRYRLGGVDKLGRRA